MSSSALVALGGVSRGRVGRARKRRPGGFGQTRQRRRVVPPMIDQGHAAVLDWAQPTMGPGDANEAGELWNDHTLAEAGLGTRIRWRAYFAGSRAVSNRALEELPRRGFSREPPGGGRAYQVASSASSTAGKAKTGRRASDTKCRREI